MTVALIDFSSIFHRIWHVNKIEAAHSIEAFVNRVQADDIIICVDSPPYLRKEVDSSYKANRDVPDPELVGDMRSTLDRLLNSGYKIARCQGWEADDVIATLAKQIDEPLTVFATDKDLLQAVDITNPFPRQDEDPTQTPESRLGIKREQIVDYLTLVGDSSDNIKGVTGIGDKTAVKMLTEFGSLKGILDAVDAENPRISEKTRANINDARNDWMANSAHLATLNRDLEIEFEQRERTNRVIDAECDKPKEQTALAIERPQYIVKTSEIDYRHSLEPIGTDSAWKVAVTLANSGLYEKFKGPEQILAVVMRGRALGIDATTALDQVHMIQGRPTLSAQAVIGIIKASPKCKYFHLAESTPDTCTWDTLRDGEPGPTRRTMTRKEVDDAGFSLQPEYIWENGKKKKTGRIVTKDKWIEMPATMLMWRCAVSLGRPVYPDLLNGIYATEELE